MRKDKLVIIVLLLQLSNVNYLFSQSNKYRLFDNNIRLEKVIECNGTVNTYQYDGIGNRIGKTVTTHFQWPAVTTSQPSDIASTSVLLGGHVAGEGTSSVTERGVFWGISAQTEVNGEKLVIGGGSGSYSATLSDLNPGGTYYVKAFATSAHGTAYGEELMFETQASGHVPETLNVHNHTSLAGQQLCFDALMTLTTGGVNGHYIVQSGASSNLVAGQQILMYPGTKVEAGGYLSARITTTSDFCTPIVKTEDYTVNPLSHSDIIIANTSGNLFTIYPNPTKGMVTIEFTRVDQEEAMHLEVMNMQGRSIFSQHLSNTASLLIDLSAYQPGVYFVTLRQGNSFDVSRVIKL